MTHTIPVRPRAHHTTSTRAARALRISATALLTTAAALGFGVAPALAHDQLVGTDYTTDPGSGALQSLTLTFSDNVLEVGTEIQVHNPAGDNVATGEAVISGRDVTQAVQADLPAADYHVAWRAVSADGHPVDGEFTFALAADGTVTEQAAEGDEHAHEHEHDHGDAAESPAADAQGPGPVAVVTVAIAAVLVVAGAIIASTAAARRKRAQDAAADDAADDAAQTDTNDA